MPAISAFIGSINRRLGGLFEALARAGYMSPQGMSFSGQGFACNNCDWKRESKKLLELGQDRMAVYCGNPKIRAYVERAACCNLFTYQGIHT